MGVSAGPQKNARNMVFGYDMKNYASWKGAPATNIIPTGTINSYPSAGNAWGTFSTNQYNSNNFFSIGTIDNVTSNLVTLATTSTAIYTYDVLTPETTGGGVTAGQYYTVLKHSSTTFSLHTPDTTNDGSKRFEDVYSDLVDDTRVSINATSFPTSWKGPPHQPNAASVKTCITNGFKYNGRKHDCIRIHTEHKPNAWDDYMAYGVTPSVTSAATYTLSFKYRAADDNSVGATINPNLYTTTNWTGEPATNALTLDWQWYTYTGTAPGTGVTYLYFPVSGTGTAVEISEIQLESGSTRSEFVAGTAARSNTEALLDMSPSNLSVTANSLTYASDNTFSFDGSSDYLTTGTLPSFTAADEFSVELIIKPDQTATETRFITPGGLGIDRWIGTSTGAKLTLQLCQAADTGGRGFNSTSSVSTSAYQHWVVTVNGTDINFYLNGSLDSNQTDSSGFAVGQWGGYAWYIGQRSNSTFWFDGHIPMVIAYDRVLTAADAKANYLGIRNLYGI